MYSRKDTPTRRLTSLRYIRKGISEAEAFANATDEDEVYSDIEFLEEYANGKHQIELVNVSENPTYQVWIRVDRRSRYMEIRA